MVLVRREADGSASRHVYLLGISMKNDIFFRHWMLILKGACFCRTEVDLTSVQEIDTYLVVLSEPFLHRIEAVVGVLTWLR